MSILYLKIHQEDNVAVALKDMSAGEKINFHDREITLLQPIKAKHKFTVAKIMSGHEIKMYNVPVGKVLVDLEAGSLIDTKNTIHHAADQIDFDAKATPWIAPAKNKWTNATFNGYHREDGKVGTANYWLVFPLVFCENNTIDALKDAVQYVLGTSKNENNRRKATALFLSKTNSATIENKLKSHYPNVDGVRFITHSMGCGGTRQDAQTLCGLLAGYVANSNVAGATILSLGCQNAQISMFEAELTKRDPKGIKKIDFVDHQESGSLQSVIDKALLSIKQGLEYANNFERKPAPISMLNIGLECGGSDGFSGISCNPLVGKVSDLLVACGGTTILSEFPELCGVEQALVSRCNETESAKKFVDLMKIYATRAKEAGSGFDMNPSPGNIKDGLITDAMKSAGAALKGGSSPIVDVLDYPEIVTKPGLHLLCTPGNDVESTTAEVGSGANLVLFTTGLGTPTGNPIAPVLKISSNTILAEKMPDIIDFNAGVIIHQSKSLDETADDLMALIIDVASGKTSAKADINGQEDFIPWKRGVSL
jgi:altronate hydrolase